MIKTGILGGADPKAALLLRLLLHHPDVDVRWAAASRHAGEPLSAAHPGLTGETALAFVEAPRWDEVDVVFVCDDAPDRQQVPDRVRVIDLTPAHRLDDEPATGYVYGLPECNRRRMVHDCLRVSCPGEVAMALSAALIPLAKNLMLNNELHVMAVVAAEDAPAGSRVEMLYPEKFGSQIAEARRVLEALQNSFSCPISLTAMQACFARGLLLTVYFKSGIDTAMVRELFDKCYDDHNFTFVVDHLPDLRDVVGTNKCLLHIDREGDYLRITSAIDNRLKGGAGNAVHVMNLLFGLHERTGLTL